jgi:peptidoglycan hydrolase CwlO-like protein
MQRYPIDLEKPSDIVSIIEDMIENAKEPLEYEIEEKSSEINELNSNNSDLERKVERLEEEIEELYEENTDLKTKLDTTEELVRELREELK